MYYLVKNNMPKETVRRRNKNGRFTVKESEYLPTEQERFRYKTGKTNLNNNT